MKNAFISVSAAAMMLMGSSALAQQAPAGAWASGCDITQYTPVVSEGTGEILYWNNPTCPPAPGSGASTSASARAAAIAAAGTAAGGVNDGTCVDDTENNDDVCDGDTGDNGTGIIIGNSGNRSGLGDGTNPGRGWGRINSPNTGTNNPNQSGN